MKKSFFLSILVVALAANHVRASQVEFQATGAAAKHNFSTQDLDCLNWFANQSKIMEFRKSSQLEQRIKERNVQGFTYREHQDIIVKLEQAIADEFFAQCKANHVRCQYNATMLASAFTKLVILLESGDYKAVIDLFGSKREGSSGSSSCIIQ